MIDIPLDKLNSLTKYPSIPTYHAMGDRGRLIDTLNVVFDKDEHVIVTEKIDGTNARIIVMYDDFIIGSREELLTARGDRIANPSMGIVGATLDVAYRAVPTDGLHVFYGEVYGGKTTGAKAYGSDVGFRLFDSLFLETRDAMALAGRSKEDIARWRDGGGQPFVSEGTILRRAGNLDVLCTPRLAAMAPPVGIAETHEWLKQVLADGTRARLSDDGNGRPEGVVVRTVDRRKVAKIRFEDYERSMRR